MLCPATEPMKTVGWPLRVGTVSAMKASMPLLASPMALSMPPGTSATRIGGLPSRVSGVMDLVVTAPR